MDDKAEVDKAYAFSEMDCRIFHGLAFASGNPIYGLIINGLKGLYLRAGHYYFTNPQARELARNFYSQLATLCRVGLYDQVIELVRRYGKESWDIWNAMQSAMPKDIVGT